MKVLTYECDICGKRMDDPWLRIENRGDIFWLQDASIHICKDCAGEFHSMMKELRKKHGVGE